MNYITSLYRAINAWNGRVTTVIFCRSLVWTRGLHNGRRLFLFNLSSLAGPHSVSFSYSTRLRSQNQFVNFVFPAKHLFPRDGYERHFAAPSLNPRHVIFHARRQREEGVKHVSPALHLLWLVSCTRYKSVIGQLRSRLFTLPTTANGDWVKGGAG